MIKKHLIVNHETWVLPMLRILLVHYLCSKLKWRVTTGDANIWSVKHLGRETN